MIGTVLKLLLAAFQAWPSIKSVFDEIVSAYVASELGKMKTENSDAIKKVVREHDQRDLEKVLGSPTAGKPSGDAGAVIVDPSQLQLPR